MHNISMELALILNLRNAALDHKEHCNHNCNVSLGQLKRAAEYIRSTVPMYEQIEAVKFINEMPIT
jgi:hypothetical protein